MIKYNIYRRYNMDLLSLHINMDTWHLCKTFITFNKTSGGLTLQQTERKCKIPGSGRNLALNK